MFNKEHTSRVDNKDTSETALQRMINERLSTYEPSSQQFRQIASIQSSDRARSHLNTDSKQDTDYVSADFTKFKQAKGSNKKGSADKKSKKKDQVK